MFFSIFKAILHNSNVIDNSSDIKINNLRSDNNSNGNNRDRKSRKKSTKSKIGNLAKYKKISRNNTMEFRLNFLISIIKKTFN